MAWFILFIAGIFETAWAVSMKYSNGFTKIYPTIFTFSAMALSVFLLSISLKSLPVGTAYAVWTGIGAFGTAVIGILLFGESKELIRLFFISLIVIGIVGLKLFSRN